MAPTTGAALLVGGGAFGVVLDPDIGRVFVVLVVVVLAQREKMAREIGGRHAAATGR
jgi:hypothetical protein